MRIKCSTTVPICFYSTSLDTTVACMPNPLMQPFLASCLLLMLVVGLPWLSALVTTCVAGDGYCCQLPDVGACVISIAAVATYVKGVGVVAT
ncbi:hypothetical protein U1Q18_007744 [Sarracenia purpurea var. burkii]